MKLMTSLLGILLVVLVALTLGGGAIVLLAYGIGRLAGLLTGFEPLQATALGLAGLLVFIILADRVFHALAPLTSPVSNFDDDEEYDDEDGDEEDLLFFDEEEETLDKMYAGIPRWRRPTKNPDFSNVNANDRCPCGSGRKFKNCHGAKSRAN